MGELSLVKVRLSSALKSPQVFLWSEQTTGENQNEAKFKVTRRIRDAGAIFPGAIFRSFKTRTEQGGELSHLCGASAKDEWGG